MHCMRMHICFRTCTIEIRLYINCYYLASLCAYSVSRAVRRPKAPGMGPENRLLASFLRHTHTIYREKNLHLILSYLSIGKSSFSPVVLAPRDRHGDQTSCKQT